MGYKNREIEVKLLVKGITSLKTVNNHLEKMFPDPEDLVIGKSKDVYFHPPVGSEVDFARVRFFPDRDGGQLTIKASDKGNNVDRIEVDVEVKDCDQAVKFLNHLLGREPTGTLTKRYIVYFLDKRDTTVSLYQLVGDSRVFLEVEARSMAKVDKLLKELENILPYELERVNSSLFQLFVEEENDLKRKAN